MVGSVGGGGDSNLVKQRQSHLAAVFEGGGKSEGRQQGPFNILHEFLVPKLITVCPGGFVGCQF